MKTELLQNCRPNLKLRPLARKDHLVRQEVQRVQAQRMEAKYLEAQGLEFKSWAARRWAWIEALRELAELEDQLECEVFGTYRNQARSRPSRASETSCQPISLELRRLVKKSLGSDQQPKRLGAGGFGVVFAGSFKGIQVALKCSESMSANKFKKEHTRLVAQEVAGHVTTAEQSACVRCEGYFVQAIPMEGSEDYLYQTVMVIELMGTSLGDHLSKDGESMRVGVYLRIQRDVIQGLKELHDSGLFHNDVKEENILITINADNRITVKISDLGLSTHKNEETRNPGGTCGFKGFGDDEAGSAARDAWAWAIMVLRHLGQLSCFECCTVEEREKITKLHTLPKSATVEFPQDSPTTAQILAVLEEIMQTPPRPTHWLPPKRKVSVVGRWVGYRNKKQAELPKVPAAERATCCPKAIQAVDACPMEAKAASGCYASKSTHKRIQDEHTYGPSAKRARLGCRKDIPVVDACPMEAIAASGHNTASGRNASKSSYKRSEDEHPKGLSAKRARLDCPKGTPVADACPIEAMAASEHNTASGRYARKSSWGRSEVEHPKGHTAKRARLGCHKGTPAQAARPIKAMSASELLLMSPSINTGPAGLGEELFPHPQLGFISDEGRYNLDNSAPLADKGRYNLDNGAPLAERETDQGQHGDMDWSAQ
eukprot:gene6490-3126_t